MIQELRAELQLSVSQLQVSHKNERQCLQEDLQLQSFGVANQSQPKANLQSADQSVKGSANDTTMRSLSSSHAQNNEIENYIINQQSEPGFDKIDENR